MTDPFPSRGSELVDRLLDLASLPQPDPWFATRTVARCLGSQDVEPAPFHWSAFFRQWALPGVAALLIGGLGLQQAHRMHTLETHRQHRVQEAFEVMASMGDDSDGSTQDTSL